MQVCRINQGYPVSDATVPYKWRATVGSDRQQHNAVAKRLSAIGWFRVLDGRKYFTGDGCRRDANGFYWITGRVDDMLNVSGHRLGTAEMESALVSHALVSKAAVVGYPHAIKGQGIYCYVTLMAGHEGSDALRQELVKHVRGEIGPIASPDKIQFAPSLPKTRSGKIMRHILRKIAENDFGALGDVSTLADPAVVEDLVANRQNDAG